MTENNYKSGYDNRPGDKESASSFSCPALGTHYALVGVPVTVKPFAIPGHVSVECVDAPYMEPGENCRGKSGAVCHFTISQMLKIDIPVDFGANVKVGESYVECDRYGVESDCANPNPPYPPLPPPPAPAPIPEHNRPAPNYPGKY